jgi:hypothetical protein
LIIIAVEDVSKESTTKNIESHFEMLPALPSWNYVSCLLYLVGTYVANVSGAPEPFNTLSSYNHPPNELATSNAVPFVRRGLGSAIDTQHLYTDHRKFVVQVVATSLSCASVLATIMTLIWFCRMRKRFRHK